MVERVKSVLRAAVSVPALMFAGYVGLSVAAVKMLSVDRVAPAAARFADLPGGGEGRAAGAGVRAQLTFVFNPRDCPEALRLGRLWSALQESGAVRVRGVVVDPPRDRRLVARLLERERIRFPVDDEPDLQLESAIAGLGYDGTPITVLSDLDRRPRLILPAVIDSLAQLELVELVRTQLELLETEARLNGEKVGT